MKLRQGNIFTSVCDSVHGGGGFSVGGVSVQMGVSVQRGLCQGDTPVAIRLRADGRHPTGMHSCFNKITFNF